MLHSPRYDTSALAYCGVTAVAAVTGKPISVIRSLIRNRRGLVAATAAVMEISNDELLTTMGLLGWHAMQHDSFERGVYRLSEFYRDHGHDGPFIVNASGHYIAVSHGELCETFSPAPTVIADAIWPERWVRHWWKFEKE